MTTSRRRVAILAVGGEKTASTRFRVLAHLPALETAGYAATVAYQKPRPIPRPLRLALRLRDELRDLGNAASDDVLLVQRRCYPPWFAPRLRHRRRPMVFDFDDAIDLPAPSQPQTSRNLRRHRRNFLATVAAAEIAICGNADLEARVPRTETSILPTAIDCERFAPGAPGSPNPLTAGWVGHSSNLGYLEALAEPLREICRNHPGFRLIVIADREPTLEGVTVEFRPWSLEREVENFRGIGIGLMPLEDSPWTRGKCAFKLLQYMALGLPAIASPVGMNREVIVDGENGCVASTGDEWVRCLDRLLGHSDVQRRLGMNGRDTVTQSFSLPVVSSRLVEILDRVVAGGGAGKTRKRAEQKP